MKLATLKNGTRHGQLVVVSIDNQRYLTVPSKSMQEALDNWNEVSDELSSLASKLEAGAGDAVELAKIQAPLPRVYEWIDGSAYLNHVVLVRKARGAEPPETLQTDPLVYQGGGGHMLAHGDDIPLGDSSWGLDFESEVAVILSDTPQGVSAEDALNHIRLVTIINDVSARGLIPSELAKGFGFVTSKPPTAFAPFCVTPDELGDAWKDGRVHLPLETIYNGKRFGIPDAGPEMHFSFGQLIAHVAKTRPLTAGTVIGSGTVSNENREKGSSCLVEKRMIETIENGKPSTSWMSDGDRVEVEMKDLAGNSVFGRLDQRGKKV